MVTHNRVTTLQIHSVSKLLAFINFIKGLVRRWVLINYCGVYEDQAKKPGFDPFAVFNFILIISGLSHV